MNKMELINTLAEENDLTKAEAKHYIERFFELMGDSLAKGARVEIRGLCTFGLIRMQFRHGNLGVQRKVSLSVHERTNRGDALYELKSILPPINTNTKSLEVVVGNFAVLPPL